MCFLSGDFMGTFFVYFFEEKSTRQRLFALRTFRWSEFKEKLVLIKES